MSQTIDSRVVEMKFDNKNFEKNVAESMKTLDNLTKRVEKLEDTQVDVDKIGKAFDGFDLSKVDKALDSITHRFSIMGQVGASVIGNLTTDAYNLVKAFSSKVWGTTFGQIKSGGKSRALNIAEAQFRIEGLGLNFDDYYDSIDKAVSGTAYGFDEAAVAASQFASSSVQAGEDMDHALRSISGMAAMTGRSYTDLASVMEDAAAAGKVTNDTFGRLSERGLAALQEYAKRTNQTVEEVRKAAQKGEIAFVEFARVMDEAYGEHATKADETFTGVTSNIRAQLSRIGQAFYSPLIENNSDLIKMFQSVKAQIKEIKKLTDPLAEKMSAYVLKLSRWGKTFIDSIDVSKAAPFFNNLVIMFDNLTVAAENLYSNILKPFGKQFAAAFYEVFPSLNTGKGLIITISDRLVELTQKFREFTADIGLFGKKGASVKDTLVGIFNIIKTGIKILKAATTVLKGAVKIIASVFSSLDLSGMFASATNSLNTAIEIGYFIIYGIATGLSSAVPMIFGAISGVCQMILDAFLTFFGIASPSALMRDKVGYWLIAGIAEGMKKALTAGLITGAILLVTGLILNLFRKEGESITAVASRLFDGIISKIAETFERFSKWLSGTAFGKAFKATFETITLVLTKLSDAITNFNVEKLKQVIGTIKQFVIIGAFVHVLMNFAAASTMFSTALYNIGRAAKIYIHSFRIKYIGSTLKNLAIAIGVITGSILLFAGMLKSNNAEQLYKGAALVGAIILSLVLAVKHIQGAIRSENIDPHGLLKIEAMFMGLSVAVWLIASAIRKVGRLDLPQLALGAGAIAFFLAAVGGMMMAISAVTNGTSVDKNAWIPILGIAAGVRIIAGAVSSLAKVPSENFWRAAVTVGGLTVLIGVFGVLTQALGKINAGQFMDNMSGLNIAAMFLAIAMAVRSISKAIIWLSYVPPEKIEQGKETIFSIMRWLDALLVVSGFAQKVLGTILLGMAATVASISLSIWLIGSMEEGITQGITTMLGILGMLTLFVGGVNIINKATGGGTDSGGVKALLYASTCIAAMGAVVWACGQLSWGEIGKGLVVVAVLCGFAAALGMLFSVLNGEKVYPNASGAKTAKLEVGKMSKAIRTIMMIKTVVSSLIKLAVVMAVFAKIGFTTDEISQSIVLMTGAIAGLSLLLAAIGAISKECPNVQRMTKPIVAATGAILVIAGSLLLLGEMESPATVITSMTAISVILLALGKLLEHSKVFGHQGMDAKGILAGAALIVGISTAITLLVAVIGEFSVNKLETVALAVGALSAVMFAIASAMKVANNSKVNMKSAVSLIVATLSLVSVAATVTLFAIYVDDLGKAGQAAIILGGVFFTIGLALKMAETVHWSVAAGIALASLSFVAIAASLAGLAYFVDDINRAKEAANAMIPLIGMLGGILIALAAISLGTGEAGAVAIIAVAGAMDLMAIALLGVSTAIYIGVEAFSSLISVLTAKNAKSVVSFFEIIGDGIGTAGQHIADGMVTAVTAFREGIKTLKEETSSAGSDFVGGFATGILKNSPIVALAAASLGAIAIIALRGDEGIDAHSDSVKTKEAGKDFAGGLGTGISENSDLATKPAAELGTNAVKSLSDSIHTSMESVGFKDIWANIKAQFSDENKKFKWYEWIGAVPNSLRRVIKGVSSAYTTAAFDGVSSGAKEAVAEVTSTNSGGILSSITNLLGGGLGDFSTVLGGFDRSSLLGEGGIGGLKSYLDNAGISMDNLSGDNIPKLIEQLKSAGLAGDDLINALKELGITEDQLKDVGLSDKLGLEEAKEGAEELKTSIQDLADEIIKGKFGNATEKWDKMFDHLVKAGMSAQDAYAAIADAQNEVNKRLGNSVVHTADEMEKKVSEAAKKAAGDASGSKSTKETRDFKANPHKAVTDTTASDAAKAAEEQMKRNMPYANYMATKEQQITAEREKQTVEAYKQKLANEHMYTLKEKEQAMAGLKANQELTTNSTLTAEKQKQLDAENKKYQAVIETYNKQQEMLDIIKKQEEATKAAEEAEKKRGEAAATSNKKAVTYGSAEYEAQKKGTTINNRKTIEAKTSGKAAGQIVADVEAAITPNVEVKSVDISQYKTQIVNKLETEVKELNTKVAITPKIDTTDAEAQIRNFKNKTQELKTTIPQTFEGIASAVSTHFSTICSKIISEGGKITSNTRAVFQNAVSAATGMLNSAETISKFYNAGKNASQGYANGIKANLATIKNAAAMMGNTSIKSTKATIKTNSPSKVFYQIGSYAGEGYVNGMLSTLDMVTNASAAVGEASTDELFNLARAIQSSLDDGMDFTPSIVPVVDTSQIQNGLNYINSSFGQDQTMDILADINATRNFRDVEAESMQAQMDNLRGGLNDLATAILNQPDPVVNANVVLQGDANGVFKVVRNANAQYTKMHGKSAFA